MVLKALFEELEKTLSDRCHENEVLKFGGGG